MPDPALPKRVSLDLAVTHGWVSSGGDAGWRERVWLLWPFFFDYDPQQKEMPGLERNLLRLQTDLAWRINPAWRLVCRAQQLVPLIMESEESGSTLPAPTLPEADYTYGGLTVSLYLIGSIASTSP